jgi:oligopeptide transport system permease protein
VATITFFLMHAVPGGPFDQDKQLPQQIIDNLNRRYHLDQPLWRQYFTYLWNLLPFDAGFPPFKSPDLGLSFRGDRDVSELIGKGFFVTMQLGIIAFLFACVVGITLGVVASLNQNGPGDYAGVFFATVGASVPNFVAATFLIVFFAIDLHWFKIAGWGGPIETSQIFDSSAYDLKKMVLPVVALGLLPAAYVARVTRASMLEVLNQDYIRTAKAKGLAEYVVVLRHAVKNAMIPVLTILGPIFAVLITGSFIIETVFAIPGVGRAFIDAVRIRDYAMIMGSTLFYALIIAVANLLVDILYAAVDPRIRYG